MKKALFSLALIGVGGGALLMSGCAMSAYDIAVQNGYEGSQQQWLESLKGQNGQDGQNGVNYEDIKNLYEALVISGDYSGSLLDFIKDYINVYDLGFEVIANQCIMSAVGVRSYYTVGGTDYYRILLSILTSRNLKLPLHISPLFPYQLLHIVIKVLASINSYT